MASIKSTTNCDYCLKNISNNNIQKHLKACSRPKKIKDRRYKNGRVAWNKGLTKDDIRVRQNTDRMAATVREQVKNGTYVKRVPNETFLQKLSEQQSLSNRGGKSKWYEVATQKVQGTYELLFAQQLEKENIVWEKIKTNNHLFKYTFDNKTKSYAPDFYLPEFDMYIEIKGFWWGKDKEKMSAVLTQHPDKKIIIVEGKEQLMNVCANIKKFVLQANLVKAAV